MLRKLVVGGALLLSWVVACSSKTANEFDCATGQADCTCTADDSCADGLVCNSRHQCVKESASTGGTGGDAGSGNGAMSGSAHGGTMNGGGRGGNGASSGNGTTSGASGSDQGGEGPTIGGTGGTIGGTGSNDGGMAGDGVTAGTGGSEAGTGGDAGAAGATDGGNAGAAAQGGTGGSNGGTGGTGGTSGTGGTTGGTAGTGGTSGGGAGGTAGTGGSAGSGGTGNCTSITVTNVMYYRDLDDAPDAVDYMYRTSAFGLANADYLEVQFYSSGFSSTNNGEAKGVFSLGTGEDDNFQTCSRCLLVDQDVVAGVTTAYYFATAGTMVVSNSSDQMNGEPVVTLSDVTLREVTINSTTDRSTLVPNGRCLNLASATVRIPPAWTCNLDWYATDDGCDCGCGARDGDCTGATVSACDACHCGGNPNNCSNVDNADNALCD